MIMNVMALILFFFILCIVFGIGFVLYGLYVKIQEKKELEKQKQERLKNKEKKTILSESKVIPTGILPKNIKRGRPSVILIVDDSPTILLSLRKLLERWGFKIISAHDGREAWKELQKNKPDLVISDIDMPELNGIELTKLMRSDLILMTVPIILITGNASQYIQAEKMLNIEGLLQKPFNDSLLIEQIHYILQE